MGRTGTRLPSFCLNRVATRVRVRSPSIESKPLSPKASKLSGEPLSKADENARARGGGKQEADRGRRIMIVVDSSPEAKAALQWALSHSVQSNDTVVLVQIVKPSERGKVTGFCFFVITGDRTQRERYPKGLEFLLSMKSICQTKKPEVRVEMAVVEGKERGPAIVEEAGKQDAALLVMGQKKQSMTWRLIVMWAGNKMGGNMVDYCIQNATCMALAVRRKSRRGGGYLITTKRHKDFWLLA
ncbi:hypothetical protein Cni_G11876 [Canna indica]|uniref:UspA domain-containing protein n=1 Tax=Canna indica TaxID=4628 RepID=A0AAQ3Q8J1_9LILI|nr:hypothetical protein Cni_G11876 [Canna indica]